MKAVMKDRSIRLAVALAAGALFAPVHALAQAQSSAEEARLIEFGKEIFKSKAVCQYCHKWDASGDQGYGGNALSLRATQLTPEQMTEVVKCGRPAMISCQTARSTRW